MRIIKRLGLPFVLIIVLLVATACGSSAPAQQATPVPTQVPAVQPLCSFVVPGPASGIGMSAILGKLGSDYNVDDPILLIDGARGTKSHMPQPGEVISLETPASNCTGPIILARQLHFNIVGAQTHEISGFQSEITQDRAKQALAYACELTRWFKLNLRFSGDLNDGCNLATAVQLSYADGTSSCNTYASFPLAYAAVKDNLPNLKWFSIASLGVIVESSTTTEDYCPSTK